MQVRRAARRAEEGRLTATRYATIIADPPWAYSDKMAKMKSTGGGAATKYACMTVEAIRLFLRTERVEIADDAHLWLWTTNAFIGEALGVATEWGFKQKTVATWVKGRVDGGRLVQHICQGRYLRNSTEHVLFCVRGKAPARVKNIPTAFVYPGRWKGRIHSEKPPVIHEWAEKLWYGPRLELFARREREGWDVVGDQVERNVA